MSKDLIERLREEDQLDRDSAMEELLHGEAADRIEALEAGVKFSHATIAALKEELAATSQYANRMADKKHTAMAELAALKAQAQEPKSFIPFCLSCGGPIEAQAQEPVGNTMVDLCDRIAAELTKLKAQAQEPVGEVRDFKYSQVHLFDCNKHPDERRYLPKGTKLYAAPPPSAEDARIFELYEQALKASWPQGAMGDAFVYWNAARIARGEGK
jgi:uncharacterized coiled-coil protein SlyX